MWDLDLIESSLSQRHEAKFIQKIVEEISVKLHVINYSIDEDLVGIETQVKNVLSFLEIDSKDDVRMIGIWGMGGAGKTTVARAIYDNISIFYEGISFVENVRECSKGMGLKELQRQILSAVLNDRNIDVPGVFDGKNMMKRMMLGRKVLVVLDDVDDISQLEALAGNPNWFKPGSRIIITTRDKQVLVAHKVHVDNIYKIGLLSDDEALCLFSRRAFGREVPIQGYEELSGKVVHYAAGLPLTIKVLGSFLYGITDRPKWVDTLERLKTIPLEETLKKLEISYDGLAKDYQEIFLDVACILKGVQKNKAIRILESCGFHAQIGLEVLEQKSLINISNNGYLGMHDHIEEMGRNIVRRLHPGEPNRHSRLWVKEEIEEILVNDLGTEDTKSMILKYTDIHLPTLMKSLRKMKKITFLSVLELENCYYLQEIHAPVGCLKNLADLYIIDCLNFECVWVNPPDFSPRVDSSVMLELNAKSLDICPVHPNSNLPKFKFDCEYGEVLPSSSGNLEKLLSFGLCACTNPESFSATICGLKHLTELSIQGNIPELPKHLWKLESLEQLTLSVILAIVRVERSIEVCCGDFYLRSGKRSIGGSRGIAIDCTVCRGDFVSSRCPLQSYVDLALILRQVLYIFQRSVASSNRRTAIRFSDLKHRRYWLPLMIGIGLLVFQQLSGINGVLFYASNIFQSADFVEERSSLYVAMSILSVVGVMGMVIGFSLGMGPIPWVIMSEVKYDGYLVEKYGDERSNHPKFDEVLLSRVAGSNNKGNVYGLSIGNDLNAPGKQDLEVC
ncbi:hypothetical protein E3N88_09560 [Mikania micrantha]|uniref:Uncharacterized protein n=1 Tax=Mikania micrantha TaxID=192012 RepID=A0A5N6PJG1_9ASTR|nr:hypothetical protein E3N88_09560 [Mikania micrantha]